MTFLNPYLLVGMAVIAIPLALHFLLKQQPKKLLFPALRLLEERRRQSMRKLKLRHVWLLALRMLALAGLVFAIARPSLPPANYGLTTIELLSLLGVVAAGVGVHVWRVSQIKKSSGSQQQRDDRKFRSQWQSLAATLALLLLVVVWPYQRRIFGEIKDPTPAAVNLPVAAVFIFDNSLSMSWQQAGQTTLDRARELAKTHFEAFPAGSRLAVTESSVDHPVTFGSTSLAARTRLDNLETSPLSLPLDDRLREAMHAQITDRERISGEQQNVAESARKDRFIRRIYIFTDLAKSAWRTAVSQQLLQELTAAKGIGLYLIDLGDEAAKNLAVTSVGLSSTRIPTGGELFVNATLRAQGEAVAQQQADLMLIGKDENPVRQGQAQGALPVNQPTQLEFPPLAGMANQWIQGEIRLQGTDPLTFDNVRRFTVESGAAPKILVVGPNEEVALSWLVAAEVQQKFKPEFVTISQLAGKKLTDFQAVTLINVDRLPDDMWNQLADFVNGGGGLIVVLGSSEISSPSYNREAAQRVLPGKLDAWQPKRDWRFEIDAARRSHPAFALYRTLESQQPFLLLQTLVYVERFWKVVPADNTLTLASFTDDQHSAALIEQTVGKGRVLLLTTGADLVEDWTNLADPVGDAWLFLAFVEQLTGYVTRMADEPFTFVSGDAVPLQLAAVPAKRQFLLMRPGLKQTRHALPANERQLTLNDAVEPGRYTLLDADSRQIVKAFSVNAPASESDLSRLTEAELNERFGEGRYKLARNLEQLQEEIDTSDLGQEVYPALLMLLVVVFCGELLVSSRFYAESKSKS